MTRSKITTKKRRSDSFKKNDPFDSTGPHARQLQKIGANLIWLPQRRIDISATEIRERAAAQLPIDHLVPLPVAQVIAREKIYHAKPKRRKRKLA